MKKVQQMLDSGLVPVVGLEPTRVAPTDFESVTSAIPSHRRALRVAKAFLVYPI